MEERTVKTKGTVKLFDLKRRLYKHFDRFFPVGSGGDKMRLLQFTLDEVDGWLKEPKKKDTGTDSTPIPPEKEEEGTYNG